MSREYQNKQPVLVVVGEGGVKVTRSGYNQETLTIAFTPTAQNNGMIIHGNEWHNPAFSNIYHLHTGGDGTGQIDHANLVDVLPFQHLFIQREYWLVDDNSHHWQKDDGTWDSESWTPGTTITLKHTPALAGGVDVIVNGGTILPDLTAWSGATGTLNFTPGLGDKIVAIYPR